MVSLAREFDACGEVRLEIGGPHKYRVLTTEEILSVVEALEHYSMEWQSIETAPKDGTEILICQATDADGKPIKADVFGLFLQRVAWWGEEWIVYNSQVCEQPAFFEPTHWMEIPPPPQKEI